MFIWEMHLESDYEKDFHSLDLDLAGFNMLTGLWRDQLSAIYFTNPHGLILRIQLSANASITFAYKSYKNKMFV